MLETVNVVLANMPLTIKEYVVSNPDTSYTIVLNARHTDSIQLQAYHHAVQHILNGDFEKESPADLIEIHAHC